MTWSLTKAFLIDGLWCKSIIVFVCRCFVCAGRRVWPSVPADPWPLHVLMVSPGRVGVEGGGVCFSSGVTKAWALVELFFWCSEGKNLITDRLTPALCAAADRWESALLCSFIYESYPSEGGCTHQWRRCFWRGRSLTSVVKKKSPPCWCQI